MKKPARILNWIWLSSLLFGGSIHPLLSVIWVHSCTGWHHGVYHSLQRYKTSEQLHLRICFCLWAENERRGWSLFWVHLLQHLWITCICVFYFPSGQIEEEEGGDQYNIEINVTDPKKIGDGLGSYMAYKVNTKVRSNPNLVMLLITCYSHLRWYRFADHFAGFLPIGNVCLSPLQWFLRLAR